MTNPSLLESLNHLDEDEQLMVLQHLLSHHPELLRLIGSHFDSRKPITPQRHAPPVTPANASPNGSPGTHPMHDSASRLAESVALNIEAPGLILGNRYRLIELLGQGGMGTVWLAEQFSPIEREVAIKLIHMGMDTKAVLLRFESERQALMRMEHPSIAQIFDSGKTDDQRPYFVMERIRGLPIQEYCDSQRMTIRERVELMIPVCQAIHHAHQRGIIHRDIKPSNVLVTSIDGKAVPKIIDFGIAKGTMGDLNDATLLTKNPGILGTPQYMSPEQAVMSNPDLDTRSDVYSLGVLLYELLTGGLPFDWADCDPPHLLEMLRRIREIDPPLASRKWPEPAKREQIALQRGTTGRDYLAQLQSELDWIVIKTLEKDRERRYGSALELCNDLQRYLQGTQVLAHPPSRRYRLAKFLRRHRAAVASFSLITLSLIVGLWGTLTGLAEAQRARKDAEFRESQERIAKDEAIAARAKAEQAELATLQSFRAATDDLVQQMLDSKPELGPYDRAYLQATLRRWQDFADRQDSSPMQTAIRFEGLHRVASLYARLGQLDDALHHYQLALGSIQGVPPDWPTPFEGALLTAGTLTDCGLLRTKRGDYSEAYQNFAKAHELMQPFDDAPDPRRRLKVLAMNANNWSKWFVEQHRLSDAEDQLSRSIDWLNALTGMPEMMDSDLRLLATSYSNRGNVRSQLQRPREAIADYRMALELQTELRKLARKSPGFLEEQSATQGNLGNLLRLQGELAESIDLLTQAESTLAELVRNFPTHTDYTVLSAMTLTNLGLAQADHGKFDAARTSFQNARRLLERIHSVSPAEPTHRYELIRLLHTHALVERANRQLPVSLELLQEANRWITEIQQSPAGQRSRDDLFAKVWTSLGVAWLQQTNAESAKSLLEKADVEYRRFRDQQPESAQWIQSLSTVQNNLGAAHFALGEYERAAERWQQATQYLLELLKRSPNSFGLLHEITIVAQNHGQALAKLNRLPEAVERLRFAHQQRLRQLERTGFTLDSKLAFAKTSQLLAATELQSGNPDGFVEALEQSLSIRRSLAWQFPEDRTRQIESIQSELVATELLRNSPHRASAEACIVAARQLLDSAQAKWPNSPELQNLRRRIESSYAFWLGSEFRFTEAIIQWERLKRTEPDAEQSRIQVIQMFCQIATGSTPEAESAYETLSNLNDRTIDFQLSLALAACRASVTAPADAEKWQARARRHWQQAHADRAPLSSNSVHHADWQPFLKMIAEPGPKSPTKNQ
ncbi:serine/threonine-protein kinase [Tuwongella immobilis]|uniref:Protein kinase domain-containing protein n=1 Tax=Tuwongella immobilis TaxID=692036 RepID=A0A6C2YMC8_9BACT|nr:serine/threonine-protein kinase [Tuwongella immobilis]VIP02283.1 serine threonine protein kinase : Serine/threonine protein kinase OS=Rhodopirellula baltica SH28 GN=RBSH_03323 PE=3 SV=1: Pkinase: TPR_2: TPR_1: TPR_10: TPR_10: TPR_2 [Tuwongella immobilis]VTS00935.1 serine threonine protein kinase : Serine/threonine protein kinase OS=Rhodopirellula baltica SH28 GN=RBSH_03323 PE=3 SV=1: Pkinase: TPR_2: TPR_1: TPR_10: TPR_10: TPR_2 [Tuwongella immobilis]